MPPPPILPATTQGSLAVPIGSFLLASVVSLATSWLLVSRLERVGERMGFSEALLGLVAALAADAPELTAAITALTGHQHGVGTGVVLGSNIFNLAALLGLAAAVAGRICLHREAVVLNGSVAVALAALSAAAVAGAVAEPVALGLGVVIFAAYVAALTRRGRLGLEPLVPRAATWLDSAVALEELELKAAVQPKRGTAADALAAGGALVVVVAASVAMEHAGSTLGARATLPGTVTGGVILAATTSLPNAVAALYLARRGRGAASLSTATNSNSINVLAGLLLPGAVLGLGAPTAAETLMAAWFFASTLWVVAMAFAGSGLRRIGGLAIVASYVAFVGSLLVVARS